MVRVLLALNMCPAKGSQALTLLLLPGTGDLVPEADEASGSPSVTTQSHASSCHCCRGDRTAGSHKASLTDSLLQISSVPSSSPEDPGKHHPGWRVPRAETPFIGQCQCLPCAETDGAECCSQDTHGQPRLDGFEPLHHDLA